MKLLQAALPSPWPAPCPRRASAQWQWVDSSGRKVFSDTPPPAGVPDKILKRPGPRWWRRWPPNRAPRPAPSRRRRRRAQAQRPRRATRRQEEAGRSRKPRRRRPKTEKVAKARPRTASAPNASKTTFDSGMRIASTKAKGEREFLDDKLGQLKTKRLHGPVDRRASARL